MLFWIAGALLFVALFVYSLRAPRDRGALVRAIMGAVLLLGLVLMGGRERMEPGLFTAMVVIGLGLLAWGAWGLYGFWSRRAAKTE